jgi:SAM-dependent methyltransferase
VEQHDAYFEYLKSRGRLALLYRRLWLYPRIARHLRGRALDVGCGIGDMLRFRANTVGADINPKLVDHCRSLGLTAYAMTPDRLPFESGSFDSVILDNVLEHIAAPQPLLAEIHRVLPAGGSFVVGVPGQLGYESDPDHKRYYSELQLHACMRTAGFANVAVLYSPFRCSALSSRLRFYALYGVYRCEK